MKKIKLKEILLKESPSPFISKTQLLKSINTLSVYVDEVFLEPDPNSIFWRDKNDEIDWKGFNRYEKKYVNTLDKLRKDSDDMLKYLRGVNKQ